jgi:hypothetical protein
MRVPAGFARALAAVLAAVLLSSVLTAPAATARPGAPRAAAEDTGEAPLAVSIDTMTPSTAPRRGNVTLTGEITNRSDSRWTDLYVYLFASSSPMTTSSELAEANATDETEYVGDRLTQNGLYERIDSLEPGETMPYTLTVPASRLPFDAPGVYWLGVHVLGTSDEDGRIDGADGRARTFIASMPARTPQTALSLVVPLRGVVRRTPDGRIANVRSWNRALGDDGRLGRLLELAQTSTSDVPVTWLVDPAVLETARSLAGGNDGFDLAPTDTEEGGESPSPGSESSETPGPVDPEESEDADPEDQLAEVAAEAQQAEAWLSSFTDTASQQTVLTLPYGDVDVATLLRGNFSSIFERANELSEKLMVDLGLDGTPVVAPSSGLFPDLALDNLDPGRTVLLSEQAVDSDATAVRLRQGSQVLLTSDVARVGGPAPTPPFDALALRQRILAEAAVHGLTGPQGQPLVVSTPDQWDPGTGWQTASFFTGLDVPWVRTVDVPFAQATSGPQEYDGKLAYPRAARRREIPVGNVLATQELDSSGSVLAELLTRNDTIDDQVGRAAMLGASTNAGRRPHRARVMTRRIAEEVHGLLGSVSVEGTPLVTMSSQSGNFQVTVVNGLDEPVTVGIDAETGSDELEIRAPDIVSLGPGQRASVRLEVTSTGTGVHSVLISPTAPDGRPLGRSTQVRVRSSQVGLVIWLIMGTGAVVFFAAIGARIVRRVRAKQKSDEPQLEEVTS